MQNKQDIQPNANTTPQVSTSVPVSTAEIVKTFSNPICKETFNSLPRIYGKKKKKPNLLISSEKDITTQNQKIKTRTRNYFSSNQGKFGHAKCFGSDRQSSIGLPKNRHIEFCRKKVCSCHIDLQDNNYRKTNYRQSSTKMQKMILPEIKKFDLQDLESQHKVLLSGTKTLFGMTGLQKIIQQNSKKNSNQQSPIIKQKQIGQKQINQIQLQKRFNKNQLANFKNKHKIKPRFNNAKFEIQQESDEQKHFNHSHQNIQSKKIKTRNQSARFKTQVNDSESSPKSSNSISLTSLVFQGNRKNTRFQQLNLSQKNIGKQMSRKPSQLSNGLFRIPQQDEYPDYIKSYKIQDSKFDLKSLIRSEHFQIVKTEDEVYFGQFLESQGKHGVGINVSQKQIFEGQYKNNVKVMGYERNIDGVYIGGFKNGLRSGFGVFKWNNGEKFQGNWENGMKTGHGVWTSPKGDYYQGQWKLNRQHGSGVFKHKISTYKGEFKDFLKDGKGSELFANGDKYQGLYKQGKPHGNGKYTWTDGGFYEGGFLQGMRHGEGKWKQPNGTIYEGSFKNDFKHGFGKEFYSSGQKYEGEFWEGARTKGKLYDKNSQCINVEAK